MVEMFEPNSVESQHLEQLHQKFFVIARWSRLKRIVDIEESESYYKCLRTK